MSYRERATRKGRAPLRFEFITPAEVPAGMAEVGRFGDMLAEWLVALGGSVEDVGYELTGQGPGELTAWAEMVAGTPAGPRLEIRMRVIPEGATILGDCQVCGAETVEVNLSMRGNAPVYVCRGCYR